MRLAEFYNYHARFGAVYSDLIASQYGIEDGKIKYPAKYYFFFVKLLKLVESEIREKANLIDIGCGMGILAERVSWKIRRYVGVDISIERVKQSLCRAKAGKCFFVVADARHLPFKDASFDTAVSLEVIEHVPDTDMFLSEIKRVLEKRGRFVFSTPVSLFFENNTWRLYQNQHIYEFSIPSLKALLKKSLFHVSCVRGIGFKLQVKVPLWLGSDVIKRAYKKLTGRELQSGYGHPVSFEFDMLTSSLLNRVYFGLKWKKPWLLFTEALGCIGTCMPLFSSNTVITCQD